MYMKAIPEYCGISQMVLISSRGIQGWKRQSDACMEVFEGRLLNQSK